MFLKRVNIIIELNKTKWSFHSYFYYFNTYAKDRLGVPKGLIVFIKINISENLFFYVSNGHFGLILSFGIPMVAYVRFAVYNNAYFYRDYFV